MRDPDPAALPQECHRFAERLLAAPRAAVKVAEVNAHLRECPTCSALAQDLLAVDSLLATAARRDAEFLLPSLRARARAAALAVQRPRLRWKAAADLLLGFPGRWVVATAAACALLTVGIWRHIESRPVGHLHFATSEVSIGGVERYHSAQPSILPGDRCVTDDDGGGIVLLRDQTILALNVDTQVQIVDSERLRLERGQIFLRVQGGDGMVIEVGDVTVTDIGTVFGVDLSTGVPVVDVVEGEVEVGSPAGTTPLTGGQMLTLGGGGVPQPVPRPAGQDPPPWVSLLLEDAAREYVGQFFPSAADE